MKLKKRGMALILTVVMALSCVTTVLIAASRDWKNAGIGDLSQYYETGNDADPGRIEYDEGDVGGTSYGLYMFIESTLDRFIPWLRNTANHGNDRYKDFGDELWEAYGANTSGAAYAGYGSNFKNHWRSIAAENPREFAQAQTDFWLAEGYTALLTELKKACPAFVDAVDRDIYSVAMKNVLWSRSVQHGSGSWRGSSDSSSGAIRVVCRALDRLGGFKLQSEAEIISAIYTECSKLDPVGTNSKAELMETETSAKYGINNRSMAYFYGNSSGIQTGVYRRLHVNEPADALVMRYVNTSPTVAEGTYTLLYLQNGTQDSGLAISAQGGASLAAAADCTALTLTHYNSGYYTLADAAGNRLTDTGSTVTLAAPASGYSQLWAITADGTLKNYATGRYLTVTASTTTAEVPGETVQATAEDGTPQVDESGNPVMVPKTQSVTTYAITMAEADAATAAKWKFNAPEGKSSWNAMGLFYPGCPDTDGQGNTVTHNLTQGNASFPLRGVISCSRTIVSVSVSAAPGGFSVSKPCTTGNWYDLEELDKAASFTGLKQGSYNLTITATDSTGGTYAITSAFTVGAPSGTTSGANDTYTVTFKDGATTVDTRTYKLGETYGALPENTTEGFQGWYVDGQQIFSNTMVSAEDHTVTAQYGKLYTVTFKMDGATLGTPGRLAEGSLITAPANPVKSPDKSYTYSFSHWVDESGRRFVAGQTYMGTSDITYTAVFNKSAISSGGSTGGSTGGNTGGSSGGSTGTASGSYLTGIAPNTSVSALTGGGYTVYDGSRQVTGGLVGTGMTAVSGSTTVTVVVTGDVSGDGRLTILDVVKLQNSVVGSGSLSGAYAKAADINGDGKVTLIDLVQAAQVTVGKRTIN